MSADTSVAPEADPEYMTTHPDVLPNGETISDFTKVRLNYACTN